MALDPRRSYAACNGEITALGTAISGGQFRIYTGTAPTNCDDAATGTLLAELVMNSGSGQAFNTPSNGVATAKAITADSSANADGTAGYWRIWDSAGTTAYLQGTCGVGATYDLNMNSVAIQTGANVSVSSFTYTAPRN